MPSDRNHSEKITKLLNTAMQLEPSTPLPILLEEIICWPHQRYHVFKAHTNNGYQTTITDEFILKKLVVWIEMKRIDNIDYNFRT